MKKIGIVIHIYKAELEEYERISLTQVKRILGRYPVILTTPEGLRTDAYKEILGESLVRIITFNRKYFNGIKGYNTIMLSREYYEAFLDFDFILFHHTDAFLFKDELQKWADKDYDNIGAPVYEYDGTMHPGKYICTGNGGLCLRKVKTFYELSGSLKIIYKPKDILENFLKYNWRGRIYRSLFYLLLLTTVGSRLTVKFNMIKLNEDVLWGYYVPKYIQSFRNAPFEEGLKFSMEFNCDKLLALNNNELPFGCHGWNKAMFKDFWIPYVQSFGYHIKTIE